MLLYSIEPQTLRFLENNDNVMAYLNEQIELLGRDSGLFLKKLAFSLFGMFLLVLVSQNLMHYERQIVQFLCSWTNGL